MRVVDRVGNRYGKLVVVSRVKDGHPKAKWLCRCDCGSETVAFGDNLAKGNSTSCGCTRARHGMATTKIYSAWRQMRQRCENPNDGAYQNYGGRGIKVCERWQSFDMFFEDMGERPKNGTLDRIDNDGPYSPENCRWARWTEQHNNRRNNRMLTAFGKTQTLTQWANEYNVSPLTLTSRLDRGKWSIENALLLDRRTGRKPD